MTEATPGQIAYEAWFHAAGLSQIVPWTQLRRAGRDAWEAAAQAVLAQDTPPLIRARHAEAALQRCAVGLCRRGPPLATTEPATPDGAGVNAVHTDRAC